MHPFGVIYLLVTTIVGMFITLIIHVDLLIKTFLYIL